MKAFTISVLLAASTLPIDAQRSRTFSKPDAEFTEPFTAVSGIRELKDGRVIVTDTRDKLIQLIDLRAQTAKRIGREGSGPHEYSLPLGVVPLPGDSSGVYDPLSRRMLAILPNGDPGSFIDPDPPQPAGGPSQGRTLVFGTGPRYTDATGRFYRVGSGFRATDNGPVTEDSAAIVRLDRATSKVDTLGYLRLPKNNIQTSGSATSQQIRIGGGNPFTPRDEWVVTPDGRVAVIRSPEYRVEWLSPRAPGPQIAYERVKVTEQHKQQWRDATRNATFISTRSDNGRVATTAGAVGTNRSATADPSDWPDFMPPFLANAALVAPNGNIWIARTRAGNDNVPKYDVLDATGKLIERVSLAVKSRVVGLGNGVVYVVRLDDDDLQYLQRFKW